MEDIAHYSYPGVVAWLESEWRRFHQEREIWENEKSLLCSSIEQLKRSLRESQATELMQERRIKKLEGMVGTLTHGEGMQGVGAGTLEVPDIDDSHAAATAAAAAAEKDLTLPYNALVTDGEALTAGGPSTTTVASAAAAATASSAPAPAAPVSGDPHVHAPPAATGITEELPARITINEQTMLHDVVEAGCVSPSVSVTTAPPIGDWDTASTHSQVAPYEKGEAVGAGASAGDKGLPSSPPAGASPSTGLMHVQAQQAPTSPAIPAGQASGGTAFAVAAAAKAAGARSWEFKACVRGHFSSVRCGAWCEGTLMVTGGDDNVVKLWDARRVLKGKEREEPLATLRGHSAPVVSVACCKDEIIAGALDGKITMWRLPSDVSGGSAKDKADKEDTRGLCELVEHRGAVWGLSVLRKTACDHEYPEKGEEGLDAAGGTTLYFASCSADGTVVLWKRVDRLAKAPSVHTRFAPSTEMTRGGSARSWRPIHCHLTSHRLTVSYTHAVPHGPSGLAVYHPSSGALLWHRALSARPTSLNLANSLCIGAVGMLSGKLEVRSCSVNSLSEDDTHSLPHSHSHRCLTR